MHYPRTHVTKLRPPARNPAYGRNLRRGLTVSRGDVAHLMFAVLGQPETIGRTIGIAN